MGSARTRNAVERDVERSSAVFRPGRGQNPGGEGGGSSWWGGGKRRRRLQGQCPVERVVVGSASHGGTQNHPFE